MSVYAPVFCSPRVNATVQSLATSSKIMCIIHVGLIERFSTFTIAGYFLEANKIFFTETISAFRD